MDMFGLGILLNAKDQASASIYRVNNALQGLVRELEHTGDVGEVQMARLNQSVESAHNTLMQGLSLTTLGQSMTEFGSSVLSPLVAMQKQTIATGSQFEQFRKTLKALYTDEDLANSKLKWGLDLAAKTPFEMSDITEALIGFKALDIEADQTFTSIKKNGEGITQSLLEFIGDLGALRPDQGLDGALWAVRELFEGSGRSMKARFGISAEWDFGNPEVLLQQVVDVIAGRAGGLMQELNGTWDQMTSNLQDQKDRFFLSLADGGFFDAVKNSLGRVSEAVDSIDEEKMTKIGTNIANAFKTIWKPVDFAIKKLVDFGTAIVNLIETSPLFSKFIVGITSLVGISALVLGGLTVLAGGFLLVKGAIGLTSSVLGGLKLKLVALGGNLLVGLKMKLITFGSTLLTLLPKIALVSGAIALLYKGWKSDFGGIRTTLTNFMNNMYRAFTYSSEIANMGVNEMLEALDSLDTTTFGGWLTYRLTQIKVFWKGLCDAWNDYTLSEENFVKLRELGLLPLLGTILDIKMRAEAFFEGFKEGWKNILNTIEPIIESIIDTIGDIVDKLLPAKDKVDEFQNATEGLDPQPWYDVGEAIAYCTGVLGGIWAISKVVGVISTVSSAIGGIITFITNLPSTIMGFVGTLSGAIGSILGTIGGLVTGILGAFGIVVTLPAWVVGLITLAVAGIVALIIKYWDEIKEFTIKTWDKIKEYTAEKWNGIVNWYNKTIKPWIDKIATWFSQLKDKISNVLTDIKDWFINKWNEAKQWYTENIQPWVEIIAKLWEIGVAVIKACLLMIKDWFIEKWNEAKEWYDSTIQPWIDIIKQGWEDFKTKVSEILTGIKDGFLEKWNNVVQWYNETIQPWIDTIKNVWENFKLKVVNVFGDIKQGFSEAWSGIKEWYDTTIQPWVDKVLGVWDRFKSAVAGVWDSISTAWHNVLGSLYDWVVDKVNGLIDLVNKIPYVEIEKIEAKTGESAPKLSANMVGLNTGGFVKQEGVALLHPNEVVVNDDLTQRLRSYLESKELQQPLNNSIQVNVNQPEAKVIARPITPPTQEDPQQIFSSVTNSTVDKSISNKASNSTVDNSIVFKEGSIQITMTNGNDNDIDKLVKKIAEKLKRETGLRNTLNYRPQLG